VQFGNSLFAMEDVKIIINIILQVIFLLEKQASADFCSNQQEG